MLFALISGLAMGATYAMVALCFNIMYSTSKVLGMGTGQFAMIGGIGGAYLITSLGTPVWIGMLGVTAVGMAFGWLTEFVAVRRTLSGGDEHLWVLSTLALSTIVQQAVGLWWGTEPAPFPRLLDREFAGVLDQRYWVPILAAIAMAAIIECGFRFTIYGKIFVALSDDIFAVRALGISATTMRSISYGIAGGFGALSGFAAGQLTYAYFALGLTLTLNGFIALAIGGIGSNVGALLGGLILGLVGAFTSFLFGAEFQQTIAIGTLIIFLIVSPAGLFGVRARRHV